MPAAVGGLVVVDKPGGWTSHDVVARLRRAFATRRVGHAGTLDPMATGVLVVGVDWSTRLLTFLSGLDKSYAGTIRLGEARTTDDAQGEVLSRTDASGVTDRAIRAAVSALTGPIEQRPSAVSAIKVDGRRAYARVRAGEEVALPARPVTVHAFDVCAIRWQGESVDLDIEVHCSSGTYVRALARDLGEGLGVGGHLTALRRLSVGPWTLAESTALAELLEAPALVPAGEAAARVLPPVAVDADGLLAFRRGQRRSAARGTGAAPPDRPLAVLGPDAEFAGVGERRGDLLVPVAVAPPPR